MTFWGGSRLANEGKAKKIVEPFNAKQIDCSAYELTLGPEAYVTPGQGDDLRKNLKIRLDAPEKNQKILLEKFGWKISKKSEVDHKSKGGEIVIPAGQFAFLLTEEFISMPIDAMGFISLKSKPKFRGLINVSGFHVDPGFNGRLIYSVFNAGPAAIHLFRGDRLFMLWIADLSGERFEDFRRSGEGYKEIPSSLISDVSQERHSLQALSEKIDSLAETIRFIKYSATALAAAIGLFAAIPKIQEWLHTSFTQRNGESAATEIDTDASSAGNPNQSK